MSAALFDHLRTGATTTCRAWLVRRVDGVTLGFTDHDRALVLGGVIYLPDSGLTTRALQQTTGLAVDNTEVLGALNAEAVTEADLMAGRYDGAEVEAWLVNWAAPDQRVMQFRGTVGEVSRAEGAFTAELRGLTESLNQTQGAAYLRTCAATLGDERCGFDLIQSGYFIERVVEKVTGAQRFDFAELAGFDDRWFERGRLVVLSGASAGIVGQVKRDVTVGAGRRIELWQSIRSEVVPGDQVRIEAGCDKRAASCRTKFANFLNFRGFPHLPGDDWLSSYPRGSGAYTGGSLFGGSQ